MSSFRKKIYIILIPFLIIALAIVGIIWWLFLAKRAKDIHKTTLTTDNKSMAREPLVATLARNLNIPWAIDFLPNGSLIFTERDSGQVRIIEPDNGLLNKPILSLSDFSPSGEGGLLGISVHPNFEANGYIYLYYTYRSKDELKNKVERYVYKDKKLKDGQIIIEDIPGESIHNGGRIKFGPDGYLYITTGDAGQSDLSQDKNSLAGKILRLSDQGKIPEDNPFPNSPVYSYGHRNPQGLAWDRMNRLWSTEHGQSATDEVNLINPGENYGWPIIRGDEIRSELLGPYLHSGKKTWAPSGTAIYNNSLLFVGLRGQALFQVDLDNDKKTLKIHLQRRLGRLRDVVIGPDGFIYLSTSNRDGRALPASDDDQILRVNPERLGLND